MIFEVTTDIRSWLRNRTKAELIHIIIANLDRINLFAETTADSTVLQHSEIRSDDPAYDEQFVKNAISYLENAG